MGLFSKTSATRNVTGAGLRVGDLVVDDSGDYAQFGPITEVHRKGLSFVATTKSGQRLSFLPFDVVTVERH